MIKLSLPSRRLSRPWSSSCRCQGVTRSSVLSHAWRHTGSQSKSAMPKLSSVYFRKLQKQQSKAEASKAARAPPQGTLRQESREVIVFPKKNKVLLAETCILPDLLTRTRWKRSQSTTAMLPLQGRSLLCLQQGQHSLMTSWNPDLKWHLLLLLLWTCIQERTPFVSKEGPFLTRDLWCESSLNWGNSK